MRRPRLFNSKTTYDICFRAAMGLPLPARPLTKILIESALARTLALNTVIICNYVWMANHPHLQVYALDKQAFTNFHGQLKKRLTDSVKRLVNAERLNLWVDRTTTGEILDLEAAIARIIYAFTNPVRAKLAKRIEDFAGCNTWREFLCAETDLNACIEKVVPWILATDIQPLSNPNPSNREERYVVSALTQASESRTQTLKVFPFKWLEQFGISSAEDIERIRQRIIKGVRDEELRYAKTKFPPLRIGGYQVTGEYRPPKKERSVFMYGSTPEIRVQFLAAYDRFIGQCRKCYLLLSGGHKSISWPPGCYIPPPPNLCNPVFN